MNNFRQIETRLGSVSKNNSKEPTLRLPFILDTVANWNKLKKVIAKSMNKFNSEELSGFLLEGLVWDEEEQSFLISQKYQHSKFRRKLKPIINKNGSVNLGTVLILKDMYQSKGCELKVLNKLSNTYLTLI